MKTLIYYEKRKILRRKSTIIACLLMLLSIIALSFVFVSDQDYYRTDGTEVSGMEAIHVKQEMDHALAGPLTAKRLKDTLQQYHTVYGNSDNFGTSGALKDEVYCKDILPYNGILNLMRRIYSPAGAYDMNILSSVTNERVENFYQDRHAQVQSIVDMDYTTGNYTQAEKDTILKLDAKVSDPITYDYSDGWKTLLTRDFPTVFLLIALVVCIIISRRRCSCSFFQVWQTGNRSGKADRRVHRHKQNLFHRGFGEPDFCACGIRRTRMEL